MPFAFFDGIEPNDVRMIKSGARADLPLKTNQPVGVLRHLRGKHLQRHVAPEFQVGSPIDLAHSTHAELGSNTVVGDRGRWADLWRQSDNVPFEQSRNVPLTASRCEDAGRTTTTHDPSR